MQMRALIDIVESHTPTSVAAIWAEVEPFVTEEIAEAEGLWIGGVGDFGDHRAAKIVQEVPGYRAYAGALVAALRRHAGSPLVVYRCMPARIAEEAMEGGGWSEEWATSLSLEWVRRFAAKFPHKEAQAVVEITLADPQAIVMRGSREEAEVVIDTGWIGVWDEAIRLIG